VRSDPQWKSTPLVAVSTRASETDIARGLEAGFDAYVPKAERDTLMATLGALIADEDGDAPNVKGGTTRQAA
jgi:two-component system chemotaxis sensor kinase CheA